MTREEFLEKYKPTCDGCIYNTSEKYDEGVYITHCDKMEELGVPALTTHGSLPNQCIPNTGCSFFELEKRK